MNFDGIYCLNEIFAKRVLNILKFYEFCTSAWKFNKMQILIIVDTPSTTNNSETSCYSCSSTSENVGDGH